jgi:L-ascorbate metabolism protein UlaG (beta-lactamase superfamily)
MKITKIGHCCLVIETQGAKIMIDPGAWTSDQTKVTGLSAVLITHEHADHIHVESLKTVMMNNPQAKIYTNSAVGKLLEEAGIPFEVLENGKIDMLGVEVEAATGEHAVIYPSIPNVVNTAFMIDKTLYYPGDAFLRPAAEVSVLALPVAGPWMKMAEAIDFAEAVKPKIAFPVHDGFLSFPGPFHFVPGMLLPKKGIEFKPLAAGESLEV